MNPDSTMLLVLEEFFLENKTVVCHCLVRFVGINRAHGCVRTVNLSVSDVAKPNQQCM